MTTSARFFIALALFFGLAQAVFPPEWYYGVQYNLTIYGSGQAGLTNFTWAWRNKCVSYVGPMQYHHITAVKAIPGQSINTVEAFCHGQYRDPKTGEFYDAKDPYNSTSITGPIFDGTAYILNRFAFYHNAWSFNVTSESSQAALYPMATSTLSGSASTTSTLSSATKTSSTKKSSSTKHTSTKHTSTQHTSTKHTSTKHTSTKHTSTKHTSSKHSSSKKEAGRAIAKPTAAHKQSEKKHKEHKMTTSHKVKKARHTPHASKGSH